MRPRRVLGFCLAMLFLAGCAPDGRVLSLTGTWEYREGFDPAYLTAPRNARPGRSSESSAQDQPGEWRTVELPVFFGNEAEFADYRGELTLRKVLPPEVNEIVKNGGTLAFNSGEISETARFFLNGDEFAALGRRSPYETAYSRKLVTTLPTDSLRTDQNVITVVLSYDGHHRFMMRGPTIEIGDADLILHRFWTEVSIASLLIGVYVVIGFYHLLLAIRRPRDRHNFYFGLYCVSFGVFWAANSEAAQVIFGDRGVLKTKVDQLSLMFCTTSFIFFLDNFFLRRETRISRIFAILWLTIAAVDVVAPYWIMRIGLLVWEISMIPGLTYIFYLTIRKATERNPDAFVLIGGIVFLIVGAVHDILAAEGVILSGFILPYTFLVFILGIALVLANRFMRVHNEVEELNTTLELKVKNRTLELEKSLGEVRELKQQQDGDYFLTSQLIQPLAGDFSRSRFVSTAYLIRQKKNFQFRKWESELGGDLCAIHQINLRGREYVVFMNGDAMGKSMQGAGGALVLGTVFKSLITRSQARARARSMDLYPETWLQECLLELQNVFVAFDGRMLISLIVGLVDEESGFLYYVNAEHPSAVLFEGGRARFLEEGRFMRKIGVEGSEENFEVKTYQMRPDDVVIVGSDGRDDIVLGEDAEGGAIVNDDERAFLRHVETGEGDLVRIEQSIRGTGGVRDDFTLMRIAYREDAPYHESPRGDDELLRRAASARSAGRPDEALELLEAERERNGDRPALLAELCETNLRMKRYGAAAACGQSCSEMDPARTRIYYLTAFALKKLERLNEAAELGERCRVREPGMLGNLLNLGDIYRRLGDLERARVMLASARRVDPNHSQVHSLAAKLEGDSG